MSTTPTEAIAALQAAADAYHGKLDEITASVGEASSDISSYIDSARDEYTSKSKSVYLDANAESGGDGSLTNPFNSFIDAISSLPYCGRVYLLSDVTLNEDVDIGFRQISVQLNDYSITGVLKSQIDNDEVIVGTVLYQFKMELGIGKLLFRNGTINIPSCTSTNQGNQWQWGNYRSLIAAGNPDFGGGVYYIACISVVLNIGSNAAFLAPIHSHNQYNGEGIRYFDRRNTSVTLEDDTSEFLIKATEV